MRLKRNKLDEKPEIQMTPMIDCVFLLLIFFMVSSTFYRQEADISFSLPGLAEQSEAVEIPDEQVIEITDTGRVLLNDLEYDSVGNSDLPELVRTLTRFRETADASKTPGADHDRACGQGEAAEGGGCAQRVLRGTRPERDLRGRGGGAMNPFSSLFGALWSRTRGRKMACGRRSRSADSYTWRSCCWVRGS